MSFGLVAARSLRRDGRGTIAVIGAVVGMMVCLMTGLVVDLGNVLTARRTLQGVTDIAAIAAATNLPNAAAAAAANAVSNNFQAAEITTVTLGTYTATASIAPSARFQPASLATANAVSVTMTHQQSLFFGFLLFGTTGTIPITTTAIAVQQPASFAIGSTVASLNAGIANAILGATIGGSVSLSLVDYNNLANAQIGLFGLANAIALQIGQSGATYGQTVAGSISTRGFISALIRVAPASATAALNTILAATSASSVVDLNRLLDFGPYVMLPSNGPAPTVSATASVFSLLQGAGQTNGPAHLASFGIAPNIPGITSATVLLSVGEPPVGTTVYAIDRVGTTVHTAQIRLYLNISLASAVSGGVVTLPLYLEIGYGTAVLAAISCSPLDGSKTQVTLNVTPGLVNATIGTESPATMSNFSVIQAPTPAVLLNLAGLATVTGLANAKIGNANATPVVFSPSDIQNVVVKTTSTTDFTAALLSSLIGGLQLQVNVIGLPVLVPQGLTTAVSAVLVAAVLPVDQLVTSILQTLGVGLGTASTWVTGAGCSAAALAA